jgi:hypothetical protein
MTMQGFARLTLIVAVTLAGCVSSPPSPSSSVAGGTGPADLSGEWVLDEASSDDPAGALQSITDSSRESSRPSPISVGVNVFGIPVGDVTDMLPERDRSGDGRRDPPRHVTDAIDALDIVQSADAVRVDYDGLGTFIYRNGAEMSDADSAVLAQWRRGRYIVERQVTDGPLVTEEFRLDANDASRLYWVVTVKVQSGRDITITRVYDRVTPDSPVNNS